MGITRWDPFQDLNQMRHQVDRYLDNFWGKGRRDIEGLTGGFGPKIDAYQTENEVVVTAEVPGIESKEDIDVRVDEDRITISGEFKRTQDFREENYLHNERYFGTFRRILHLPAKVLPDQATASYENGLLEIRMIKSNTGESRGKRVQIN